LLNDGDMIEKERIAGLLSEGDMVEKQAEQPVAERRGYGW